MLSRRNTGKVVISAILIGLACLIIGIVHLFKSRETPFSAAIDTSYLSFTPQVSDLADPDTTNLGLLASERFIDLTIDRCSKLTSIQSDNRSIPCSKQGTDLKTVQLAEVSLPSGTPIRLAVKDGAVHVTFGSGTADGALHFVIATTKASRDFSGRPLEIGRWKIDTIGPIQFHLEDSKQERVVLDDSYVSLGKNSSFSSYDQVEKQSGIVGENSILILPELPKDLQKISLERGDLRAEQVLYGNIRHLTLNRKGDHLESFHVDIAGTSPEIIASSIYSPTPRNEALSWFDASSGRDPRLHILAVCGLLIGLLSAVSSLSNIVLGISTLQKNSLERSNRSGS